MRQSKHLIIVIICLLALLAVSLSACIPEPDSELEKLQLEQTSVALEITQTAMAQPAAPTNTEVIPPTDEPLSTAEPPALPTIEPSPTLEPTAAPDVDFLGISFSYDESLASSVSMAIVPEQVDEYEFPGGTYPTHYSFEFNGYALPNTFHEPVIRVYPIAEFEALDSYSGSVIAQLQTLLQTQPAILLNEVLPHLPLWNAGQMFSAKAAYVTFQNGLGVRYLTMHGQAAYPIDNYNMFYTFQGITNDGQYLLTANLPISNPALPERGEDTIDDWNAFYEFYEAYLSQASMQVDEYAPESFNPTLALLDEMMASFLITPEE